MIFRSILSCDAWFRAHDIMYAVRSMRQVNRFPNSGLIRRQLKYILTNDKSPQIINSCRYWWYDVQRWDFSYISLSGLEFTWNIHKRSLYVTRCLIVIQYSCKRLQQRCDCKRLPKQLLKADSRQRSLRLSASCKLQCPVSCGGQGHEPLQQRWPSLIRPTAWDRDLLSSASLIAILTRQSSSCRREAHASSCDICNAACHVTANIDDFPRFWAFAQLKFVGKGELVNKIVSGSIPMTSSIDTTNSTCPRSDPSGTLHVAEYNYATVCLPASMDKNSLKSVREIRREPIWHNVDIKALWQNWEQVRRSTVPKARLGPKEHITLFDPCTSMKQTITIDKSLVCSVWSRRVH